MNGNNWVEEFSAAITVCDADGIIISMNAKAQAAYAQAGGRDLIGKNMLDCHPEPARTKLAQMLKHPAQYCYTTEKNGVKKLINHSPWYEAGVYKGYVEIVTELPPAMPHYVRK